MYVVTYEGRLVKFITVITTAKRTEAPMHNDQWVPHQDVPCIHSYPEQSSACGDFPAATSARRFDTSSARKWPFDSDVGWEHSRDMLTSMPPGTIQEENEADRSCNSHLFPLWTVRAIPCDRCWARSFVWAATPDSSSRGELREWLFLLAYLEDREALGWTSGGSGCSPRLCSSGSCFCYGCLAAPWAP